MVCETYSKEEEIIEAYMHRHDIIYRNRQEMLEIFKSIEIDGNQIINTESYDESIMSCLFCDDDDGLNGYVYVLNYTKAKEKLSPKWFSYLLVKLINAGIKDTDLYSIIEMGVYEVYENEERDLQELKDMVKHIDSIEKYSRDIPKTKNKYDRKLLRIMNAVDHSVDIIQHNTNRDSFIPFTVTVDSHMDDVLLLANQIGDQKMPWICDTRSIDLEGEYDYKMDVVRARKTADFFVELNNLLEPEEYD